MGTGKIKDKIKDKHNLKLLLHVAAWVILLASVAGRLLGNFGPKLNNSTTTWWIISMPVFWIGVSQYFVLFRLMSEEGKLFNFYANLSKARRSRNSKDIRDTYTHLREHSNSVFIVVVEVATLGLLMAAIKSTPISSSNGPEIEAFGARFLIGLFIWMVPTVFMWARANSIERDFSENTAKYVDSNQ